MQAKASRKNEPENARNEIPSLHGEQGGIRTAMLAVAMFATVMTWVLTHQPETMDQVATIRHDGWDFAVQFTDAYNMVQDVGKTYPLAYEQVAINAAQSGMSFNACAETASCALEYNAGADQNVPTTFNNIETNPLHLSGAPTNLAIDWKNIQYYAPISWFKFGIKPWNPGTAGTVLPIWPVGAVSSAAMRSEAPSGFFFGFAGTPAGHALALKDYYGFVHTALEVIPPLLFGHPQTTLGIGSIQDAQGLYNQPQAGDAGALRGDLGPTGGEVAWFYGDGRVALPLTGAWPDMSVPSAFGLYGLGQSFLLPASVMGAADEGWAPTAPNAITKAGTAEYKAARNEIDALPNTRGEIGVPYGYFLPAMMSVMQKGSPAGLALQQRTTTQTVRCPPGDRGSITATTTEQLQTTGNPANPTQWVDVNQAVLQNTCTGPFGGTVNVGGGGGTTTAPQACTATSPTPVCNAGQTTVAAASWDSGTCTWIQPDCACTTQAPADDCGDYQVETAAPVENTSNCTWTQPVCATATFSNTGSTPGPATSCPAGYSDSNGYCVANNAYVADGYGNLGLGYTTLNLYNAVYSPNANGQYVWSGNIGIQIGGGTALAYGSINAAFLNTAASSGTVTVSDNETAVGPLGLSMLSGSGSVFNNQYETPAQIAANGYGEVLSVIMGGGTSAFSGAAPGTNLSLTGTNANGTIYTRELYNGPTAGPTTAALYFNDSGFYVFEQNPGACGSINGGGGNLFVSGTPATGATILGGQGCNAVVGGGCIPGPNGQCTNSYKAVVAQLTTDICTGTNTTIHPPAGTSACTTIVDAKAGPAASYSTPSVTTGGAL